MKASFSYEKVTPESAELGDYSEIGWILPGMWEFPLRNENGDHESTLKEAKNGAFDLTNLSEIIYFAESLCICEDTGSWLSSVDPDQDYQTGEDTYYSLHIEGVTASTYGRIKRYLGIT